MRISKLRPVGNPIPLGQLFGGSKPCVSFVDGYQAYFYQSGTASLAAVLLALSGHRPDRRKVILPAYACPDVLTAVLFCGLEPVVVDFEQDKPFLSFEELKESVSADVLAVIAVNFLGIQERIPEIDNIARPHGVMVIEDSAQLAPWKSKSRPRAHYSILSFGRGKPESVLTGGCALVDKNLNVNLPVYVESSSVKNVFVYTLKVLTYNLLSTPIFFGLLSKLKFLGIGKTKYKTLQTISGMNGTAKKVLFRVVGSALTNKNIYFYDWQAEIRNYAQFGVIDLAQSCHLGAGAFLLRHPILVKSHDQRQKLLALGSDFGMSALYPSLLPLADGVPIQFGEQSWPNAQRFCDRLVTLPCHVGVTPAYRRKIIEVLDSVVRDD